MTAATFLGDSLLFGSGGVTESQTFARAMSVRLGWTPTRVGRGGTGFVAPNGLGKVFADYIGDLGAPAVLVIEGGINDVDAGFGPAVRSFFTALRAAYPTARLYVALTHGLTAQRRADLAAAATGAGAELFDWQPWVGPADTLDGIHPTLATHDRIGGSMAYQLGAVRLAELETEDGRRLMIEAPAA